jgi:hypothetical protein
LPRPENRYRRLRKLWLQHRLASNSDLALHRNEMQWPLVMNPLVLTVGFDATGAYSSLYCGSSLDAAKTALADAIAAGTVSLGWVFQNPVPTLVLRSETVTASVWASTRTGASLTDAIPSNNARESTAVLQQCIA